MVFSSDLVYGQAFVYNLPSMFVSFAYLVGEIENSDAFYVYTQDGATNLTKYSLFAEFPNCSKCQTNSSYWFNPYTGSCSRECDSNSQENFPFCEPKCTSENCESCSSNLQCTICNTSDHFVISRGNISVDCMPKLQCLTQNYYVSDITGCTICDNSCNTCVGSSNYQCLSCSSGLFYDVSSSSCQNSCDLSQYNFADNVKYCMNPGECFFGYYTALTDLTNCTRECNSSCGTCLEKPDYCLSCADDLLLVNNTCIQECPQGYYYGNNSQFVKTCLLCSECNNNFCQIACSFINCQYVYCEKCEFLLILVYCVRITHFL